MEDTSNVITAISTAFIALAACGGTIAAWVGLSTWKKQQLSDQDTRLAQGILILLYRHRDAVRRVRNGVIFQDEVSDAMSDADLKTEGEQKSYLESARVYEKRWDTISKINSELYPLLLEADVIWGRELRDKLERLWSIEDKLKLALRRYLRSISPATNGSSVLNTPEKKIENFEMIFADYSDEDVFEKEHAEALGPIEEYLRGKLLTI